MKRLIIMLAAGLTVLALGACGKHDAKPEAGAADKTMEQAQPVVEHKESEQMPAEKSEEQKPSAQADQYNNGMAEAKADDAVAADQDQDANSQS